MIEIRPSASRGLTKLDWLESRHSFSFGQYRDPHYVQFRNLRVINEDRVAPGGGFPRHPHRDMEIVSYVVAGALEHDDSMGQKSVIKPEEMQRISAGTGIEHSESNPSQTEPVHFLQIWLLPEAKGLEPRYAEKSFRSLLQEKGLVLAVSREGREDSIPLHQDVDIWIGKQPPETTIHHQLAPRRHAWLQLITGRAFLNSRPLEAGDGAAVSEEEGLSIETSQESHFLLFDLN